MVSSYSGRSDKFWSTRKVWHRAGKVFSRDRVCDVGREIRSALLLPGIDVACLHCLQKFGVVTPNTRLLMVERDWDTYLRIWDKVRQFPNRKWVEHGELESIDINECMSFYLSVKNFDFAYLDWCGPMTDRRFDFIRHTGTLLEEHAVLSITLLRSSLRSKRYTPRRGASLAALALARTLLDSCEGGRLYRNGVKEGEFSGTTARLLAQVRGALRRKTKVLCCYEYNDTQLAGGNGGSYMTTFKLALDSGL